MKTLVVEDEFTSRVVVQRIVSQYGECHIAVSGEEALEAYRHSIYSGSAYDLICMDIKMPGMDGIEALQKIRALEEELGVSSAQGAKIVMTTIVDSPKEVVRSFTARCDAYVVKPIEVNKFLDELRGLSLIV